MANHRLDAAPDTVHWGFFDAALKPLLTVASGDTVTISTVSGMASQMPPAPLTVPPALAAIHEEVQQKLPGHICTGPVAVKGAKAGQVLEVRIKDIQLHYDWGYNMIRPLAGALPDDFDTPTLIHIPLDKEKNTGRLPWGLELAARAVLRRDGGRAAAGLGHDLDAAAAPQRRQSRQQGTGEGHHALSADPCTTVRCSRSATAMARRATARCASPRSRPG